MKDYGGGLPNQEFPFVTQLIVLIPEPKNPETLCRLKNESCRHLRRYPLMPWKIYCAALGKTITQMQSGVYPVRINKDCPRDLRPDRIEFKVDEI